ncbi:MAG: hypothetical protein QF645_07910, partial [Planctomycetota bacterium]|nr:hypothetical protein [Planctomycetota bacterium]
MPLDKIRTAAENVAATLGVTVLFVQERVMRRVIRRHRRIPRYGGYVPHSRSYQVRKPLLKKLIQSDPATTAPFRDNIFLITLPEEGEASLEQLWRYLFHEQIHLLFRKTKLSPQAVRERIHQIGQVEFDEIRTILRKEEILLPTRTPILREPETYGEFLSTWLELKFFSPHRLESYFPGIAQRIDEIYQLACRDINCESVYEMTRPEGANRSPEPTIDPDPETKSQEIPLSPSSEKTETFRRKAEEAKQRGNRVRAALAMTKAGDSPGIEIASFAEDLAELTTIESTEWENTIQSLLKTGKGGRISIESRVLYDLQNALIDHADPPHKVDIVEALLQFGNVPIRRPLPALKEVLPLKHFQKAAKRKLPVNIRTVLERSLDHLKRKVRDDLRPQIKSIVSSSGLSYGGVVASVAVDKMIEELLDSIIQKGFFTFGELRDAIARNQARLGNLSDPLEFIQGDPLLRLDHAFRNPLEGVYESGEIYLRWLQRFSSLFFGTSVGRFLTRFFILPFGGSFVLL